MPTQHFTLKNGHMNTIQPNRKDNRQLIDEFHQRVTKKVQREFIRKGYIRTKVVLLCLDASGKPVYTVKHVPDILSVPDERFLENFMNVEKKIETLVEMVKDDGYDVLCVYHCEFEHVHEGEGYFSSLKRGQDLRDVDVFHHRISYANTYVRPDGSIEWSSPNFELLDSNW